MLAAGSPRSGLSRAWFLARALFLLCRRLPSCLSPYIASPPSTGRGREGALSCPCCSVAQSCLSLCDPMNCSTPGLPVPHHLPELPKFMFIASVMPSSHLILWHPLLLCPQSFPASGTFPVSHLFASDDQNSGASASASALPVSIQGWFPLRLTGLISLLSRDF